MEPFCITNKSAPQMTDNILALEIKDFNLKNFKECKHIIKHLPTITFALPYF